MTASTEIIKKKKKNETNSGAKEYNEIKGAGEKGGIESISSKLDQAEESVHSKYLILSREDKR